MTIDLFGNVCVCVYVCVCVFELYSCEKNGDQSLEAHTLCLAVCGPSM